MNQKPLHYDGSVQVDYASSNEPTEMKEYEMTEEIRKNIGENPYSLDQ